MVIKARRSRFGRHGVGVRVPQANHGAAKQEQADHHDADEHPIHQPPIDRIVKELEEPHHVEQQEPDRQQRQQLDVAWMAKGG